MIFEASLLILTLALRATNSLQLLGQPQDLVQQLIGKVGYESEVHSVETQDGYILNVHRIKTNVTSKRPRLGPVFLMHGYFANAADFIIRESSDGLPFLLSLSGYDVWLGNSRGSDYGRNHRTLTTDMKEFWDFTWHEIGFYDLPAMIDYVLSVTNAMGLFYVGHSQGGSSFCVMCSTRPDYNKKVIQSHLLAPAVFMKGLKSEVVQLFLKNGKYVCNQQGSFDFSNPILKNFAGVAGEAVCQQSLPTLSLCRFFLFSFCGFNKLGIETDVIVHRNFMKCFSHSVGCKQTNHFYQQMVDGSFRQYDYYEDNYRYYRTLTPPEYDLKQIKVPVYLYSGSCDAVVPESGVLKLKELLSNVRKHKSFENYNHCDFNYGINSKKLLFNDIVSEMNKGK